MSKPQHWNITLDFDRTCTDGHSGGTYNRNPDPMSSKNKERFVKAVKEWIDQGHNVVILTRGIDVRVENYLIDLGLNPVLNDFKKGELCIYAPDEQTFFAHGDENWWANEKVNYMTALLEKSDIGQNKTIFMDDTLVNVKAMSKAYSDMKCEPAKPGDYESTFAKVNSTVQSKVGGTRRKRNHRSRTRRRR